MIIYLDTKATPHWVSSASISDSRGVVEKKEEEGEKCGLLANCSIPGGGGVVGVKVQAARLPAAGRETFT